MSGIRTMFLVLVLAALPTSSMAQTPPGPSQKDSTQADRATSVVAERGGIRFNPGNRRDPFLNPLLLRKTTNEQVEEVFRGTPPPGIRGMYIAQVQLLGVSLREGGKTAVFQGTDKRAYFLREGDRFFDGFLKRIDEDSALLVRETKMRSGETVSQEVWKRLRTP